MQTGNPVPSSSPVEVHPPPHTVPAHPLPPQVALPDTGYVSPRQHFERRTPTGSPFQPGQKQPQLVLNPPRPSLSPLSEYHSGFSNEDIVSSPCPSPSPSSLANHRRQHSFPNLLPLAFRSRTPSPVRKTHARSPSEQMPYTGDHRTGGRAAGGGGGFMGWLSGPSESHGANGPSSSSSKDASATTPDTTPTRLRRGTTADLTTPKSTTTIPMTTASRFILQNLHQTALGLLTKMQAAYRTQAVTLQQAREEKAAALRDAQEEKGVLQDELEEAQMRGEEETDEEEDESVESESVFSRCRSPALPQLPAQAHTVSDGASVMGFTMDGAIQPAAKQQQNGASANAMPKRRSGQPQQPMNALQKILKGISGDGAEADGGCGNCQGKDASVAWDTVGLLRDENKHLKKRVGELEVAVEGALDLVKGVGL
ncbi:hypothetical protein N0V88_001770 [Collariella sp. IMI 366227]|nr:hypothetical protein N0V88_001770 [Collariella sp. IMI 366227]